MSENTSQIIGVTIYPDTHVKEHKDRAVLDDTVQKNWISQKLADRLGLQSSSNADEPSADWREQKLQSVGVVTFAWYRNDVQIPNSYTTTFHVAQDDSVHLVIGSDLLSNEKCIKDSQKMLLSLTSSKKGNKGSLFLSSLSVWSVNTNQSQC